jgi:hypothetical protein
LSTRNQDREGKKRYKIPTLINGSAIMSKNDTPQRCQRKNSTSKGSTNSTSRVQHKVFILGNSHLRGSVVKLRNELSANFKISGVIRPGAGTEKIVNSFVEDLQNVHLHDVIVLNAGAI